MRSVDKWNGNTRNEEVRISGGRGGGGEGGVNLERRMLE